MLKCISYFTGNTPHLQTIHQAQITKKKYTSYFGKAYGIECSALGQIKLSIISTFLYANNLVDF